MTPDSATSLLRDMLRVYDHRFLDLDGAARRGMVAGTRLMLADGGLADAADRAALPAAYRMRAFCIRHDLQEELERLVRDEVDGVEVGTVVVGGRVYAVYPYLRGVPRQDADVTAEIGLDHRLDAVGWQGGARLRVRGHAAVQRVQARETKVALILRERRSGVEHHFPAEPGEDGFTAYADVAVAGPGRWDAYVAAEALGIRREERLGGVRGPKLKTDPQQRLLDPATEATAYFTKGGHLAVLVRDAARRRPSLRARLRRRLTRS
ncbi:hypothetical protein [Actinomadura keratinilytica]|uniref:Uncharacterized protein n=1 Tax=Actinomadura keratinilytica TaxID=547461 RepID=A0ABP7ZA12_9ACTN